jgi:threonine/homoserine/homoserine lactone efflux protein
VTATAFFALAAALLLVALTPGPALTAIVARAIADGLRPALALSAGVLTGDLLFLTLAAAGMATVARSAGELFVLLKLAGALYLVWQGVSLWRWRPPPPALAGTGHDQQLRRNFAAGLLLMFGHVQAMLFYAALLPGFVDNMAVFCDFENVALGVRDAKYEKFDIARCSSGCCSRAASWSRRPTATGSATRSFKAPMHEASFELIEIPHVRQSGKNSADIRMVVDALDLCYTKAHVDTFVIISGDSDFSPLVSKLRENNKTVIGVGVKNSTSDLLIANCDEFIFYDDLVRAELGEYSDPSLRSKSERQLRDTRAKYEQLMTAMRRAESKLDPALRPLRDQVLYLKHNLNARAIAGLQGEVVRVDAQVAALVRELDRAIAEADRFIAGLV